MTHEYSIDRPYSQAVKTSNRLAGDFRFDFLFLPGHTHYSLGCAPWTIGSVYFAFARFLLGFSVLGQYLLTYGFLYVSAVEGSIISSSRILLAALLGPLLVADLALSISGWCGALLIFAAWR